MSLIDITKFKSILCLNGDLPPASFFSVNLPIIAADGAANQLMEIGITPDIVIGDLDSIKPEYKETLKTHFHYDQNFNDFSKSLMYLESQALFPSLIVGVQGGYLDHVLNNINLFLHTDCVLYAPPIYGFTLKENQQKNLSLPLDTKISLLGIPEATATTKGLEWDLTQMNLRFPGHTSCFNRTTTQDISLNVHHGHLLVLIYE